MCKYCEQGGFSGPRVFIPPLEESGDEAELSSKGRDVLGFIRISLAFGGAADLKPMNIKFMHMLYDVPPSDQEIIKRLTEEDLKAARLAGCQPDPGERIALALEKFFGVEG